jgi:23S rRNA maturation-related 3'-5' exoribonuclease YhaM
MTRQEQIDFFRNSLMSTEREGMADLLDFISDLGFLDAPASGGNHLCKDGGLLEHTVNVMLLAEKIGVAMLGGAAYNKIHNSVIIAAGLHDLGKCGRYGSPYYVENMIQDGKPTKKDPVQKYKRSEAKPFKISSDLCHIDHPLRSVELAARYIDLTEEEEHAIFYHDGAYGSLAYDLKGHEEPLQVIVHFADFWAAQFQETGKLDVFKDPEPVADQQETTEESEDEGNE